MLTEHVLRLDVDQDTLWDVDDVKIEITTRRKRLREWMLVLSSLIAGTLLEALLSNPLEHAFGILWEILRQLIGCR